MKRFLLITWNVVAAAAFVLGVSGWPVNVEVWFDWIRGVPSHAWRWIFGAGGFAINAASFVYLVVIPRVVKARREKRAEERYVDYSGACYIVSGYTKLWLRESRAGVEISTTKSILDAFERSCPEGKHRDDGYDGHLLHAWIRYNAGGLLLSNTSSLKALPPDLVHEITK